MDTFVDKSLIVVRKAVTAIGKRPLAALAGVPDGCLRHVDRPEYSPTARTLRKLERAAAKVLAESSVPSDASTHEVAA